MYKKIISVWTQHKYKQSKYLALALCYIIVKITKNNLKMCLLINRVANYWLLEHFLILKPANGEAKRKFSYDVDIIMANLVFVLSKDTLKR